MYLRYLLMCAKQTADRVGCAAWYVGTLLLCLVGLRLAGRRAAPSLFGVCVRCWFLSSLVSYLPVCLSVCSHGMRRSGHFMDVSEARAGWREWDRDEDDNILKKGERSRHCLCAAKTGYSDVDMDLGRSVRLAANQDFG
ncbi:hypothetical protein BKA81DRAFT_369552 [Phyllosticta paracitricarpa]|uniref:Uncharacterized protein n=1 Tax=Phyllosticta paracitricarpa TaxID=2016321 RepID=A0ABR1MX52_9PEZI